MPIEYLLAWLGWRIFRGKLRVSSVEWVTCWMMAALLAPLVLGIGHAFCTIVDILVTRQGVGEDLPPVVLLWLLHFLLAPVSLGLLRDWRRARSSGATCVHCGYDLTGNMSGVCPECGSVIAATGPRVAN
jgi:hypothetical protein